MQILGEIGFAVILAAILPFFVRYFLLPSSIYHEYPLNVIFNTCDHDLHSVCSFPAASLEYEKNHLFSANIYYALIIRLKFADIETTKHLGLFQNSIEIRDEHEKLLKKFTKSAVLKEPTWLTRATWITFFPLYFLGAFHDYSTLEVALTQEYLEILEKPSTKLIYTLHDKFANIEEAQLRIIAKFGLIRNFLYYWPISSTLFMFFTILISILCAIGVKYAYLHYFAQKPQENGEILDGPVKNHEKPVKIEKSVKKEPKIEVEGFSADEFQPETFGESPKNEILHDTLRKRK
ncbi:unnamed protein product [Caenorhabditis angaria]|uniref:Seipin n=1 Tax=Caenorhabditis angaria TaxID=860376 RepID=A0A9P1IS74_9PELO|nr:unnamed protein product [Caenorhabditis angaria]